MSEANGVNKRKPAAVIIFSAAVVFLAAASLAVLYFSFTSETASARGELPRVDTPVIRAPAQDIFQDISQDNVPDDVPPPEAGTPEPALEAFIPDEYISARASEILASMTDKEKLYQLFFVTPEALTGYKRVYQAGNATKTALERYPVGGIVYFESNIDTPGQISDMLAKTQELSKIPLFLGVDEEGGRVARISSQRAMGFDAIPPAAELGASGDPDAAYSAGVKLGDMLSSLGFNMDFAPVADVLTNPANTEIGDRSFGSDAALVAEMTASFVEGLHTAGLPAGGIASALKHFPGHGGIEGDSHAGYVESSKTADELRQTELLPFAAGIAAGADFVLVSHLSATGIDASGEPSSLSSAVVTGLLRNELGFGRIIITDSLSMGAVTDAHTGEEAAVLAVQAGADMLLMPPDLQKAAAALEAAVADGRLTTDRIDESVLRILYVKLERGIIG
ncbi:MAG: glycoside hydrolase family 3 protein [Oscillospiraceae bacterium]|jgi:beta-N-acetylhexosaminidase|nr:glycoside hydrolase family 3 protein [Oscillospiraceae bacterium]